MRCIAQRGWIQRHGGISCYLHAIHIQNTGLPLLRDCNVVPGACRQSCSRRGELLLGRASLLDRVPDGFGGTIPHGYKHVAGRTRPEIEGAHPIRGDIKFHPQCDGKIGQTVHYACRQLHIGGRGTIQFQSIPCFTRSPCRSCRERTVASRPGVERSATRRFVQAPIAVTSQNSRNRLPQACWAISSCIESDHRVVVTDAICYIGIRKVRRT